MRRGLLAFVILSVLLTGVVSAALCTEDSDIILKLSGTENAHGAVYNEGDSSVYGEEICYSDIFELKYPGDERNCANTILKLSDTTNAHAEGPGGSSYTEDICYGDLSCTLRTSCQASENAIVYLSDITNAHLAVGSSSGYPYVICCVQSGGGPADREAHWEKMNNEKYPPNSNVYIGNKVRLVATNIPSGKSAVNFLIYDDDPLADDEIHTISNVPVSGGVAEAEWEITQAQYDLGAGSGGSIDSIYLQIFFETTSISGEGSFGFPDSDTIFLYNEVNNRPPVVQILGPEHRQIYFTDTILEFSQDSFDYDGDVESLKWMIEEDGFTSEKESFQHTFTEAGLKTITVQATDNQGKKGEDQIAIVVLDSSQGMLAFINKPEHQAIVEGGGASGLETEYSAEDSYVVESNGVEPCPEIECLAGNCPSTTKNTPNDCASLGTTELPVTNAPQGFGDLFFSWAFYGKSGGSLGFTIGEAGLSNGLHDFGKPSEKANDKLITLNLRYPEELSSLVIDESVEREFTLVSTNDPGKACVGNELWEYDEDGTIRKRNVDLDSGDRDNGIAPACAGPDEIVGSSDDCSCSQSGWYCTDEGCQPQPDPESTVERCSDYVNSGETYEKEGEEYNGRDACNLDIYDVADDDELWDELECDKDGPEGYNTCACEWDGEDDKCNLVASFFPRPPSPACTYTCTFQTDSIGECNSGFREIVVSSEFVEGDDDDECGVIYDGAEDECQGDTYHLPCGRTEIALPFFGAWQFLAGAFAIGIIYIFIISRRPKKGK